MKKLAAVAFVVATAMISARSAYAVTGCSTACHSGTEPCSLPCTFNGSLITCGDYVKINTHAHCVPDLTDDNASVDPGALTLHDDASCELGAPSLAVDTTRIDISRFGATLVDDVWSAVRALPVI